MTGLMWELTDQTGLMQELTDQTGYFDRWAQRFCDVMNAFFFVNTIN